MLLELQALRALRSDGTPLHLSTTSHTSFAHTLYAQDRGSFGLASHNPSQHLEDLLLQMFRHYPDPVTINGQDVVRVPFPDLSCVTIAHTPGMERRYVTLDQHHLAGTPTPPEHLNTYTGGILTDLLRPNTQPRHYLTQLEGPMPHWKPCGMVNISPVFVLTNGQLDAIADQDREKLFHNWRSARPTPTLKAIEDAASDQLERTLQHPDIPPPIRHDPMHYVTGAPLHSDQSTILGAPILPIAEPALFRDLYSDSPRIVSAAQALYRTDAGVVPAVTMNHCEAAVPVFRTIEEFDFATTDFEPAPAGAIRPVKDISMNFRLNGDDHQISLPAPFLFQGQDLDDLDVQFVPSRTTPTDLLTHMARAYREYNYHYHKQFHDEDSAQAAEAIQTLLDQLPSDAWTRR